MSIGFNVAGFRVEFGLSFLTKKALLSILFQLLEAPAVFNLSVTVLTFAVSIKLSKLEA